MLIASFENQGAHMLARICDPEGERTVGNYLHLPFFITIVILNPNGTGVLTKPDRIPSDKESLWLPFVRNEKLPLQNHWFCVKQPSANEMKQHWTWEQAREKEGEFFYKFSTVERVGGDVLEVLEDREPGGEDGQDLGQFNSQEVCRVSCRVGCDEALTFFLVELVSPRFTRWSRT
jgi:hypothetical protein